MNFHGFSSALLLLCLLAKFSGSSTSPTYLRDDISLSCGSTGTSSTLSGREWIGDKHPKLALKGISTSSSTILKMISGDPVIHKTARISHSLFSYSFHLNPGEKIIRFHFNPTPYRGFKRSKDFFTVKAGQFTLMSNFSASLTAQALGVNTLTKQFYLNMDENQPLKIVFSPSIRNPSEDRSHAFINGIEILSVPAHLSHFRGGDPEVQVVGRKSMVYIGSNSALEIINRLNVKQEYVMAGDEFDVFGSRLTFPAQEVNEIRNRTWKTLVDVCFRYLVRIHFCEVAATDGVMFKIIINEMIVDTNADFIKENNGHSNLWYMDYLVAIKGRKQDYQQDISITLQSKSNLIDGHKILEGFEILKVSNDANSLSSPSPMPSANTSPSWIIRHLPTSHNNVISAVAVTVIALVSTVVYVLRRSFETSLHQEENMPSRRAERLCQRFSLSELQSATRDFSAELLIGRGGFGNVYKGVIKNGQQTVAIKRLKLYSHQGKHEFLTEIETLSELRHINLVSLIGYCNELGEMILVYEYLSSGTLCDHLYKLERRNECNSSSLTWTQRLNICIGAARGLDYLHTGHNIIHRDVKDSNILLDEKFVAKVADFGLAKLEDKAVFQTHVTTNVKGTFGYVDPYYFTTHRLTRKSDTYAFGVVLLQVLCGRPSVDLTASEDERSLTFWARDKIKLGEVDQIIASSLVGKISADSLKTFVNVAERCLQDEPKKRPTMAQIVLQLEFALWQQDSRNVLIRNQESSTTVSSEQLTTSPTSSMTCKTNDNDYPAQKKDELQKLCDSALSNAKLSEKIELPLPVKTVTEICEAEATLQSFDFSILAKATNQFSSFNEIQHAHYRVYKAVLPEGDTVAVYRPRSLDLAELKTIKKRHLVSLFQRMIEREIKLLSRLYHQNIIGLIGYCIHEDGLMLVYEFTANGSLDTYIFDKIRRTLFHWARRVSIIIGIARGFVCLHQDSGMRIIHRNPNSQNILLDANMSPKISDFSIAESLEDDHSEMKTNVHGVEVAFIASGYIAPDVHLSGKISFSSDVYSFGVLILEVLSGRRVVNDRNLSDYYLLSDAWRLWNKGKALDLVDELLEGAFLGEEALICIQIALLCIQREPSHRPMMASVLKMLLGEVSTMDLHEKVKEAYTELAEYSRPDDNSPTPEDDNT